ncbi:GNAT family N-acetyltransferase [Micromonospora inositola]|uniref:Acetyltransferase (GNAT) family protein n=1 Tax=Micromonospora inositola TaxID=47865 RepID=A0A1C5HQF2_9ACTN|nr:GNAT family N-acetyltransferase [Micromonospora inositola]SCG48212.1 Acetyltransferase (GNAT) family protein [Micromonospora inositola]
MNSPVVTLRPMRQDEYENYTARRDLEYVQSLAETMPAETAMEKARQDRALFLPQGLATERHRLLVAENTTGQVVGYAWVGLEEPRTKTTDSAWLYDISVEEPYRRSGYGRAILAAVEAVAREAGATRLGLNVFGHNAPAISLYQTCGYEVTTQQMAKRL